MDAKLKVIVYVSCAKQELGTAQLQQLLRQARLSNRRHGITGVLLHEDRDIMQALEGPPAALDELVSRIRQDRRHTGFLELYAATCNDRVFPDWPMGFGHSIDDARGDGDPGGYGQLPSVADHSRIRQGDVLALLQSFHPRTNQWIAG